MKKVFFFMALASLFCVLGCSKDDDQSLVANTEWASKITDDEIEVPEEYRENGYWVLKFTRNEFTLLLKNGEYTVKQWCKGTYKFTGEKTFVGTTKDLSYNLQFVLYPEKNEIWSKSLGMNLFVKQ